MNAEEVSKESKGYQLKIELQGIKPEIWRRVVVPADISLEMLHNVIQIAMGWDDYHLHLYKINDTIYISPDESEGLGKNEKNEIEFKLNDLLKNEGETFEYHYDFGDGWIHKIQLESIQDYSPGEPVCIEGKRACPPEDLGGPSGYEDFIHAIRDPKHPRHQEFVDWIGDDYDPEEFDVELTNELFEDFTEY